MDDTTYSNLPNPNRSCRFQERELTSAKNSAIWLAAELSSGLLLSMTVFATFSFPVRTAVVLVTSSSSPRMALAMVLAASERDAGSLDGERGAMAESGCG